MPVLLGTETLISSPSLTAVDYPATALPVAAPQLFPLRRDGGTWARASMAVAITAAIAGPACEGLSQLKAYR